MYSASVLRGRFAVSCFILILILSQLIGIALAIEDWPLTSAPMFAHYHERQQPKFHFLFVGRFANGREQELRSSHVGLKEQSLMRQFFGKYYGSTDPWWPHGHLPDDTPAAFQQRMERFWRAFVHEYEKRHPRRSLVEIRLIVRKITREQKEQWEDRIVGVYHVDAGNFDHVWLRESSAMQP